jgi:hypothetical protein
MKAFFNKFTIGLLTVLTSSVTLVSCNKEELEVQKGFPFEVVVMPIADEISNGQTVEMRFDIQRTDNYIGTQYFIRYFQYDGLGLLRYYNQHAYLPNDLYPLAAEQFRLYYTSKSTVTQSFTIWISDNFGNEKQLSFQLNSSD